MMRASATLTTGHSWLRLFVLPVATMTALSGCAVAQPGQASAPAPQTVSSPIASATASTATTTPSPSASPSPTPAVTTSTASPSPSPSATAPTTPTPPPSPTESLTAEQLAKLGNCVKATVGPGSSGTCTSLALKMIAEAGYYSTKASTKSVGTAGANAILNYQRSRGIKPTAYVKAETWAALASNAPILPEVMPEECKTAGVVLCVDKAHRKLSFVKNGSVVKAIPIRVGGWNTEPKTGKWRVFSTVSGTWRVFDKKVNPPSDNYGSGAMPYSVMFQEGMYVHYSSGFASVGYAQSSHGCVNVASLADAKWFYANTPVGAKVFVF